jgi:hypothetical protein
VPYILIELNFKNVVPDSSNYFNAGFTDTMVMSNLKIFPRVCGGEYEI